MIYADESEFEDALVEVLQQHGWKDGVLNRPTEQELIDNWADILFKNNSGIDRLNGCRLTNTEMGQILDQVAIARTPLALNSFINGKTISIKRDNPDDVAHLGKEVSLKIFDRLHIAAGESHYQIARQPIFKTKSKMLNDRRGDVCLLINGMPVIHIELKRSGVPISQACNQIEKYAHEGVFTGIFQLVQIFVAMNPDDAVYFANPGQETFNPDFFFHWEDVNNELIAANKNPGKDDWKKFTTSILSIPMAHRLVGTYTIADNAAGCLKVLRSYQYYAASKIADVVEECHWDEPEPTPGRRGGYIWHTTGSGKTMTSFKSAQLIAESKLADKVVFLMDRVELGTQSLAEYKGFADNSEDVQGTDSTDELKSRLGSKDPRNTLIVTSIQKMSNIKAGYEKNTEAEIKKLAAQRIVFIVDECHRSTFGDMLQDIRKSFPNALFFGFTGTPIHDENKKKGSTTSDVFGDCLRRYSIADGIRDGNVLGFDPYMVTTYDDRDVREQVALHQAKAKSFDEVIADPKKSKVFYHFMDEVPMSYGIDDAGNYVKGIEDYLNKAQYAADTPHEEQVVDDIIKQFPIISHGNKFHAIFATSSIPEAISYYRLFRKKKPDMHVTALFDPNIDNNEGATFKEDALVEIISDYNKLFKQDFTIPKWPLMKRDISTRLAHKSPHIDIDGKRDQQLDLLIVVDQMLTGFDSKWVNTLYLDKVIDYESIIQAFSRTNRLFGPDKPFGVIRYYRKPHTMKTNIAAAVELYSGSESLPLFALKLPDNVRAMDRKLEEIKKIFEAAGIEDFVKLPEAQEARAKFGKCFIQLNDALEQAKVQGFNWNQKKYIFEHEDGTKEEVVPKIDEHTYLVLVQRYKELFSSGGGPGEPGDTPYDIDGHITEIDTGLIDTDYMNANFDKWLKALNADDKNLQLLSAELHRSFANLSQEEQRYAELFLHDIEDGDVKIDPDKTFRDYIAEYARKEQNRRVQGLVKAFGADASLLEEMLKLHLTEHNIDEYGRFEKLKNSIDADKTLAYYRRRDPGISLFSASIKAVRKLREFILTGETDVDQ